MAGYKHLEIPGNFERYVKDKRQSANAYYRYFLTRLYRMFEYKNLPDTIPHEILDRYLFNNGIALITEVEGKLYAFYGNLGGPQDVYYRPTQFIVANPHIKTSSGEIFSANVTVFPTDSYDVGQPTGVLIRNDGDWIGLAPMLSRYSYLLAENILTLRTADVMLRITSLLTAPSDKERAAAIEYLKTIESGNLGVIGESPFFDGVKLQSPPSNNGSYLTQFIEYQQYLKGSLYNELGLSANYNMKREAIGKGESTLDEDALLPLCDDMLLCRKQDLAKVNEMFGTNIEVSFSSAWLENRIEAISSLSQMGQPTPVMGTGIGAFGAEGEMENGEQEPDGEDGADGATGADGGSVENETQRIDEGSVTEEEPAGDDVADDGTEGGLTHEDPKYGSTEINDMSNDEVLDKIMEEVESDDEPQILEEGDDEDGLGTEETEDSEGDISDS